MDAADRLREAAQLGPFFAVETVPSGPGWQPYADLLHDPVHLRARVAAARGLLAERAGVSPEAIDERASASIQHLGTVARLVSPLLAATTKVGESPLVTTETLYWRALPGGPVEFAMQPAGFAPLPTVLANVVDRLSYAFATGWHLSAHILRGNVASALAGAAKMIGSARPELRDRSAATVRGLLDGPLDRAGTWPDPGSFRRHNCCLFYRIPGGGTCGDCVLNAPR